MSKPSFNDRLDFLLKRISTPKIVRQDTVTGDSLVCHSCGGIAPYKHTDRSYEDGAIHNPFYCEASEALELLKILEGGG